MELMNLKLQAVEHQNLKAEMKMLAFVADHSSLAVMMREMVQQGWGIGLTSTGRMKTATGELWPPIPPPSSSPPSPLSFYPPSRLSNGGMLEAQPVAIEERRSSNLDSTEDVHVFLVKVPFVGSSRPRNSSTAIASSGSSMSGMLHYTLNEQPSNGTMARHSTRKDELGKVDRHYESSIWAICISWL